MRTFRKRVAVVYEFFPHYRAPVIQELLTNSANTFTFFAGKKNVRDTEMACWSSDDKGVFSETKSYGVAIGKTPYAGFQKRLIYQTKVVRLAVSRKYDTIIYLGDAHFVSTWMSAAIARILGKRVLFWTIGWLRDEQNVTDLLRRMFYSIPHALLLYGHYARRLAMARGFDSERLYVVYNSLDYERQKCLREQMSPDRIRSVRRSLFHQPEVPIVACCSRLQSHRRLDWLIEAVALLHQSGFSCNVLLIGDGPERKTLETLASQKHVTVTFEGACFDEERLAELLMASDVTVAPGMVGLTAMQSLAYGTPVITHGDFDRQSPEWEAVVDGETGSLFRCGDIRSLAATIHHWLSTNPDREAVARQCVQMIETYFNPDKQREVIDRAIEGLPALTDPYWSERIGRAGEADHGSAPVCHQ